MAICGFRAWPVLHFEKERESYNSRLSILSDTETGLAISGRVTQARQRSADTDTATDWVQGRGEGRGERGKLVLLRSLEYLEIITALADL